MADLSKKEHLNIAMLGHKRVPSREGGVEVVVTHTDEIIGLSRAMQRYFLENYGREMVYIPNGVNRPAIAAAELIKEKYGLEKDDYMNAA